MRRRHDYSSKKYQNPLFARKEASKIKRFFYYSMIILAAGGAIYFLVFWDFFEIKNIKISGNKNITENEIMDLAASQLERSKFIIFKQKNIFLFSKSELKNSILERVALKKINIKREFPDTLKIEVFENEAAIIWLTQDRAYYVDSEGVITAPVTNHQKISPNKAGEFDVFRHQIISQNLPLVYDPGGGGVEIGQKISNEKAIDFILKLVDNLDERIRYKIAYFNFNIESREVTAAITEGWEIKFNIDGNLNSQLDNLTLLLEEEIESTKNLDYIDLRFGERVFYK